MFCPEGLPIRLSPKARNDIRDILRYAGETWGFAQMKAYGGQIDKAFQLLGANPLMGRRIGDRHLAHSIGSHVIVYRIEPEYLGIVRILHRRVCPDSHL